MHPLSSTTPVTTHSVIDSDGRRIAEYNQTSDALIREYVWNGWDPIAVIEGGVISFIRADHIGRPVFATNSAGAKVWTATPALASVLGRSGGKQSTGLYSDPPHPFGSVHTSTGAPPTARFPGQWFQSESGLHQNWMRHYDPTTGRYLQANPLGLVDGASVYGYVRQSPMRFTDPTGEAIPAVVWAAVRFATYAYAAYQIYCAETWEDVAWAIADVFDPRKKCGIVCAIADKAGGGGKGGGAGGPKPNPDPPFTYGPGNNAPFEGPPCTTVRCGTGSRTYGDDGYPATDRDWPHPDHKPSGNGDHSHDWGRPPGGGPPTHADRGPPREVRPGDPPPPRGPNVPPP